MNEVIHAAEALRDALKTFPSRVPYENIAYLLNPLDYAWPMYQAYVQRYAPAGHQVEALFLGMNPGPWGMAQTGIPFGSPDFVQHFLGLEAPIHPPEHTHPKRPILGLQSPRTEISGKRLWGGIQSCFGTPQAFFKRFFVANYCPLLFQNEKGANLTPNRIPRALWQEIRPHCVRHLERIVLALKPRMIIGVGGWVYKEALKTAAALPHPPKVGTILHPSPASPAANRGWLDQARTQLEALGFPWPAPNKNEQ